MSRDILLSLIDPDPNQPRQNFDQAKLAELAQSMAPNGLAVPILLRPAGERFIIVHGERRYRAALSLGWETIQADVREVSPDEARWLSLVENVQRADLSPIEEARAYQARLADGTTQTALGERIGKSQSYIATKLRFLTLPEEVQAGLNRGALTEGHIKQLLRVTDQDYLLTLYSKTIANDLSVKLLNAEVNQIVSFLETRQKVADLEPEQVVSDTDLLLALGCELPWRNYWPAEDFRYCGDRLVGIFARFMWLFGGQRVHARNFSAAAQVWFDLARQSMHRKTARDLASADLVFVNLPAHYTDGEIDAEVKNTLTSVRPDAVAVFRTGPEEIDGEINHLDIAARRGLHAGDAYYAPVICMLAEWDWLEENRQRFEVHFANTRRFISVKDEWLSASMSHDIVAEHFQEFVVT